LKLEKPDELFKLYATVYKLNEDILPALLYLPFITSWLVKILLHV